MQGSDNKHSAPAAAAAHRKRVKKKRRRGLRGFWPLPIDEMKQFAFLWSERIKRAAQGVSRALLTRHCHCRWDIYRAKPGPLFMQLLCYCVMTFVCRWNCCRRRGTRPSFRSYWRGRPFAETRDYKLEFVPPCVRLSTTTTTTCRCPLTVNSTHYGVTGVQKETKVMTDIM